MKSTATFALTFFGYIISVLASVCDFQKKALSGVRSPWFGVLFSILTRPRGSKQDFICRLQCTATKTIRPRVKAALTHIETRISWSSRGLLAKLPRMDEHLRCDLGISWKEKKVNIIRVRSSRYISICNCRILIRIFSVYYVWLFNFNLCWKINDLRPWYQFF